jgi:UDP-3-O-[3-hydroxymyristoyl] glucosamine N-acyltransferase
VGVRVDVAVGVRLTVQVAQWVSVGRGVQLGARVLVALGTGVDVMIGVSVGTGVSVARNGLVGVSDGVIVAVHVGVAVADAAAGKSGRVPAPLIIKETQAIDRKTSPKDSPKKRLPADLCRLRSGQLALRRLTCMEWMPARKLK